VNVTETQKKPGVRQTKLLLITVSHQPTETHKDVLSMAVRKIMLLITAKFARTRIANISQGIAGRSKSVWQ
jgi:hypothetical protein